MTAVYILRCVDGTLYIGHTENLDHREKAHNDGAGAAYTASRRPVSVVYSESFASKQAAIARERQLKRWTRRKKEALIAVAQEHGVTPWVLYYWRHFPVGHRPIRRLATSTVPRVGA